jgi:hypothetical protein
MSEEELERMAERITDVVIAGGPEAERILELFERAQAVVAAEGEAWVCLDNILSRKEVPTADDAAELRAVIDQGLAAESERGSIRRELGERGAGGGRC